MSAPRRPAAERREPVTDTTGQVTVPAVAAAHLQDLGEQLRARGLHVRLGDTAGGLPQLIVISTAVPTLSEVVFAARGGGRWWFWWSWAERIAPVEDMPAAVALICRALTPRRAGG
ncbi:hypothetical protein Sru01_18800 [Sphaerisporangium rufum]|uniref:Uncharacterized protein n=1 Tax=Sphaerisporangium rufum TaxID=1381558 RepID=A0A919R0U2_9ACTN|nr:hypothetical protein [Sphaerisporangium rufum]GII76898.1 hypothetical protein Sru01_18800 [Sphaerisporangium rufum]